MLNRKLHEHDTTYLCMLIINNTIARSYIYFT